MKIVFTFDNTLLICTDILRRVRHIRQLLHHIRRRVHPILQRALPIRLPVLRKSFYYII